MPTPPYVLSRAANAVESPRQAGGRRSAASLAGTNLERACDYNRRIVLQAIRMRGSTTRLEIARQTGLASPTIANITSSLVEQKLILQVGRVSGGRGQPAWRIEVNPGGAFGIGLHVECDRLSLVLIDLAGRMRSRICEDVVHPTLAAIGAFMSSNMPRLLGRRGISLFRILGVGISVSDDREQMERPGGRPRERNWTDDDLLALIREHVDLPVYVEDDAAAAAIGEAQTATALANPTFFYLLVGTRLRGGPVVDRTYHRGADGRSGEIGLIPDGTAPRDGAVVQDTVSLSALAGRLAKVDSGLACLDELKGHDREVGVLLEAWIADATRSLLDPLLALSYILSLDAIVVGGRLPPPVLKRLIDSLSAAMGSRSLSRRPKILAATSAGEACASGAAMLPILDRLLPSHSVLTESRRFDGRGIAMPEAIRRGRNGL